MDYNQFQQVARAIYQEGRAMTWPIPTGADQERGNYGLLPDDRQIETWMIPEQSAAILYGHIRSSRAQTILELGASIGYSTVWLAKATEEVGGHVYTTEIFADKAQKARENFRKVKLNHTITLLEEDIVSVLNRWQKPLDFVFMDADKQRYGQYLDLLWPLLVTRGMIVVDNVGNYPQHMPEFLEKVRRLEIDGQATTQLLEVDHGLLFIWKKG